MKNNRFFIVGMLAVLLTFGLMLAGCDNPAGGTFVAVTDITGVPTIAIVGNGLTLSGTIEPPGATNKTIVWSGTGVNNGVLTATSAGDYTVTATIVNGASESAPYTKNFSIKAYNAGSDSGTNPFGTNATPFIWAMDDRGGEVYAILKDSTWEAMAEGSLYNSGTYTRIGGKAVQWTVGAGGHAGDTGLAIIGDNGKLLVANFADQYSDMNGTFTKLDTSLTSEGTWVSSAPYDGRYVKIVAASGNFTEFLSPNGTSNWAEVVKGTYSTTAGTTNPAACTITQVNTGVFTGGADTWVAWNALSQAYKNNVGGYQTFTVIIYANKFETQGLTFQKQ
jgi:hypothetical protein